MLEKYISLFKINNPAPLFIHSDALKNVETVKNHLTRDELNGKDGLFLLHLFPLTDSKRITRLFSTYFVNSDAQQY